MKRREFLKWSIGTAAVAVVSRSASAQASLKEIRIGYQKNGVLVIARQQATLEKHFVSQGIDVKWVEFSSGPPMLEAMNVGSVDYGAVGDSPAGVRAVGRRQHRLCRGTTAHQRAGHPGAGQFADPQYRRFEGQARRIHQGLQRPYITVQTLEKAGLTYADITPVYLTPPDAGPAFANGSIDAWSIWDPYFAIGETKQNGRVLVNASEITKTNSFYIANRDFAKNHGAVLQQIIDVTTATANGRRRIATRWRNH